MFLKRNPWVVPVALVVVGVALYFGFISSRSSIDQSALLTNWVFYAAVFVIFAVIANFAYRSLRRSSSRAEMDEARSKGH